MAKRLLVLMAVLTVAVLSAGYAPAAPSGAVCQITGSVALVSRADQDPSNGLTADPLSDVRRLGAYDFRDTNISCRGVLNGVQIDAVYSVTARGATTGLTDPSGDNCQDAKNDAAVGIYNNRFNATKTGGTGPTNLSGAVNFSRVSNWVDVMGTIDDLGTTVNENWTYTAQLNFTPGGRAPVSGSIDRPNPDANQLAGCAPGPNGGITTAALDGLVVIASAS